MEVTMAKRQEEILLDSQQYLNHYNKQPYQYEIGSAINCMVTESIMTALQITEAVTWWLIGFLPDNKVNSSDNSKHATHQQDSSNFTSQDLSYYADNYNQTLDQEDLSSTVSSTFQANTAINEEEEIEIYSEVDDQLTETLAYYIVDDALESDTEEQFIFQKGHTNANAAIANNLESNVELSQAEPTFNNLPSTALYYSPNEPSKFIDKLNDSIEEEIEINGESQQNDTFLE